MTDPSALAAAWSAWALRAMAGVLTWRLPEEWIAPLKRLWLADTLLLALVALALLGNVLRGYRRQRAAGRGHLVIVLIVAAEVTGGLLVAVCSAPLAAAALLTPDRINLRPHALPVAALALLTLGTAAYGWVLWTELRWRAAPVPKGGALR